MKEVQENVENRLRSDATKVNLVGRPKKPLALRKLILKIARETGWGYTRVLGEIRKLTSRKVSRQTVRNIMKANGLDGSCPIYAQELSARVAERNYSWRG